MAEDIKSPQFHESKLIKIAFAYVKSDLANAGNLEIEIQGQRRKTKILDKVVYDPDNKKLKA